MRLYCLYCGRRISGKGKKFCCKSHGALFNKKKREAKLNKSSPEQFIKEALELPPATREEFRTCSRKYLVTSGKRITLLLAKGFAKDLLLKEGDLIEITIKKCEVRP